MVIMCQHHIFFFFTVNIFLTGFQVSRFPGTGNPKTPLLFLLPPPSHMSQELFFLSTVFTSIGSYIEQWEEQRWDPLGLIPKVLSLLAKPDPGLGDVSTLDMLGLIQKPPSSQPPTAPSLPPETPELPRPLSHQ